MLCFQESILTVFLSIARYFERRAETRLSTVQWGTSRPWRGEAVSRCDSDQVCGAVLIAQGMIFPNSFPEAAGCGDKKDWVSILGVTICSWNLMT